LLVFLPQLMNLIYRCLNPIIQIFKEIRGHLGSLTFSLIFV
jgi:hypothetical protein